MPSRKNIKRKLAGKPIAVKVEAPVKETVVYEERVPIGIKWLIVLLIAVGVLVYSLVTSLASSTAPNPTGILVLSLIVFIFLPIIWNFRALEIKLSTQEMIVRYGRVNKMIVKRKTVSSCEPLQKVKMTRFPAIGPRTGLDGSRGYLTSLGPAVQLNRRGEKDVVISSRRPEELCAAIERFWNK